MVSIEKHYNIKNWIDPNTDTSEELDNSQNFNIKTNGKAIDTTFSFNIGQNSAYTIVSKSSSKTSSSSNIRPDIVYPTNSKGRDTMIVIRY
ncbi:MAG: hypothetical protein RLZZ292_3881 [Bacteroidota bacterium]